MRKKLPLIILILIILGVGANVVFTRNVPTTTFERETVSDEELEGGSLAPVASQLPSSSSLVEILPEDCSNECASFQNSPDRYTYCRSVCGLSSDPTLPTPQPTDPNLAKDLERKNEAIKGSSLSGCEAITDARLRKTCQVRVTEDLLE